MSRAKRTKNIKKVTEGSTANFNPVITKTDMNEEMQKIAIDTVKEAFSESKVQKDLAARIKKKFDSTFPSTTWHCIVGNHFAVSITHQTKYLCFIECAGQSILLFKSQE